MNKLFSSNPRMYLWTALALLVLANYQTWMRDYPPATTAAAPAASAPGSLPRAGAPGGDLASRIPEAPSAAAPRATVAPSEPSGTAGAAPALSAPAPASAPPAAPVVHVRTDVLDLDLSTRGGTLTRLDLLAYPQVKGEAAPVRLANTEDPRALYTLQSGLIGPEGAASPTHLATFSSALTDYRLDGRGELRVPLTWNSGGLSVTKTFVFRRGEYRIGIEYEVHNGGDAPWAVRPYAPILRNDPPTKRSYFDVTSYAFHGPAIYDGARYRKLDTADAQDSHLSVLVRY